MPVEKVKPDMVSMSLGEILDELRPDCPGAILLKYDEDEDFTILVVRGLLARTMYHDAKELVTKFIETEL